MAQARKRRVAFLDLDLRMGDAALQFDVTPHHALREALEHSERIDDLFLERGVIRVSERLDLLASEEPLNYAADYSEDALLTLLDRLRHGYRYVFVDLPACDAARMPRVLHLPSLCLLVSDGTLAAARDVARWRGVIGANSAERKTLHILNRTGTPASLPLEEFTRAAGQAPDIQIAYDRDVANASNFGVRRLEECHGFMRALSPALQHIGSGPVDQKRSLFERVLGL
jgi:pilus assembly protein CpaE